MFVTVRSGYMAKPKKQQDSTKIRVEKILRGDALLAKIEAVLAEAEKK